MNGTWFIHSWLASNPFPLFPLFPLYPLYPLFFLYPVYLSFSSLSTHHTLYILSTISTLNVTHSLHVRYVPICTPAFSVDNCGREEEEGNHLAKSGESMQALAKVRETVRVYLLGVTCVE